MLDFGQGTRGLVSTLLAALLISDAGCATVRPYRVTNYFRSASLDAAPVRRVAVLPFENLTSEPAAGPICTDEFSLQLGRTGLFDLVERGRIDELWREQDLDTTARFDASAAVRIGRMLGAQAVVLGTVNRFVPHPELRPDTARGQDAGHEHRHDAPVVIIGSDRHDRAWEVFAAILAVVSVVGIVFLLTRPRAPAAEAGIQARLVDVESGEVLWQAKESFNGGARSVQALVTTREDQKRIAVDVEYLARILCRELTQTLLATNGGTIGN